MKRFSQLVEDISNRNKPPVNNIDKPIAIFVTGGPGSGKDIIVRECIVEHSATELNLIQAMDILHDKGPLSEHTQDVRRLAILARSTLIINGPADDITRITSIKEELEDLGYDTKMIFVSTTNESSKKRNSTLRRMMNESMRKDKWDKSQSNMQLFFEMFSDFVISDNSKDLSNPFTMMYESKSPTLTKTTPPKISRFSLDKDRVNVIKRGDKSLTEPRRYKGDGVGPTYSGRLGSNSNAVGGMIGNPAYAESVDNTRAYNPDDIVDFSAGPSNLKVNPIKEKKTLKKFRETIEIGSPMGVTGVAGGATNKDPLVTPLDKYAQSGITIKKKKLGAS